MKHIYLFLLLSTTCFAQELVITKTNPISSNELFVMNDFVERDNLYYGTTNSGELVIYIDVNQEWTVIDLNPENNNPVENITLDNDGGIWISSDQGLYYVFFSTIEHFTTDNSPLVSNDIGGIEFVNGKLWIGFNDVFGDKGYMTFEDGSWQHFTESNSELEGSQIEDFYATSDGSIIGGGIGEVHYFEKDGEYSFIDLFDDIDFGTIERDFYEDSNGDVLIATNNGIVKFLVESKSVELLLDAYGFIDAQELLVTPNGELWVSERFVGLHFFESENSDGLFFSRGSLDLPFTYREMLWINDSIRVLGDQYQEIWTFSVSPPSSIDELSSDTYSIFPNPTTDYITLQSNGEAKLSYVLSNMQGQQIRSGAAGTIPIQDLSPGVYHLEIIDTESGDRRLEKIVKQ
jgi:hypothetical protein